MNSFDDILNTLIKITREHEEPYKEGAWENFLNSKQKKMTVSFWPIFFSGLVASLLIGFLIFTQKSNNDVDVKYEVVRTDSIKSLKKIMPIINNSLGDIENIEKQTIVKTNRNAYESETHSTYKKKESVKTQKTKEKESGNINMANNAKNENMPDDTIQSEDFKNDILFDPINDQVKAESQEPNKRNKIKIGFSLSPLLTSNGSGSNLGFSTGVQTDFKLAKNILFNCGLLISHQTIVQKNDVQPSIDKPVSINSKSFSFDIPVNIKFKFKDGKNRDYYLLAGISSVGYITENNSYNYQYQEVVETTTTTQEGQIVTEFTTVTTKSTVNTKVSAFSNVDISVFFNLSYGIRYPLTGTTNLTIAPYLKLPLSGATTNNFQPTSGGINFIISK